MFRILSSHELFRKLGIWDSRHFIVTLYNHINLFISGVFWGTSEARQETLGRGTSFEGAFEK